MLTAECIGHTIFVMNGIRFGIIDTHAANRVFAHRINRYCTVGRACNSGMVTIECAGQHQAGGNGEKSDRDLHGK